MNHIDLFSGIGGFSLGLEREGFRTIAFVEQDAFCNAVLRCRWPSVPRYGDVTDLGGLPVSGLVGSWQESRPLRLSELADVRPTWVVVENVYHTWRRWVPELRRKVWEYGYASLPLRVRASDIGAHHERARCIVVAHADRLVLRELSRWWQREGRKVADELAESWDYAPRGLGTDDGLSDWSHLRRRSVGNAILPQVAQLIGRGIRAVTS